MPNKHPIASTDITGEFLQSIENQLKLILESKYFKSAKQMKLFLKHIVEKTIAGEGQSLKQYTIGLEALSFADDFDPDTNPAVRIMGGRVRKRLNEYYEVERDSDEIIISMSMGSYIPQFIEKSQDKSNTDSATNNSNVSRGPKLAIISFSDKTQSPSTNLLLQEHTDILATEISHSLFLDTLVYNPYADKDQSRMVSSEINIKEKIDYHLNLFLQKADSDEDKYIFVYRLIDVETDDVLWSESYVIIGEPKSQKDFLISKITATVTDYQQGMMHNHWARNKLASADKIPDHHNVLVCFREYVGNWNVSTFAKGVNACLEALHRNPNDVIANILYAAYCRREYVFEYEVIESPLEKGEKYIETAIKLNPNAYQAHYIYGMILFCQKDIKRSVEEFELARSISKNDTVIEFGIGFHFCKVGQWDKGLRIVNRTMSRSSSYSSFYHLVPFLYFYRQEKYEEALHEAKKITSLGTVYPPLFRCVSYEKLGRMEEAKKEFQEVLKRYPQFMKTGKVHIFRYLGTEMLAEEIWDAVLRVNK